MIKETYTGTLYGWMTTRGGLSEGLSAASGKWKRKGRKWRLKDGTSISAESAQKIRPKKEKEE